MVGCTAFIITKFFKSKGQTRQPDASAQLSRQRYNFTPAKTNRPDNSWTTRLGYRLLDPGNCRRWRAFLLTFSCTCRGRSQFPPVLLHIYTTNMVGCTAAKLPILHGCLTSHVHNYGTSGPIVMVQTALYSGLFKDLVREFKKSTNENN